MRVESTSYRLADVTEMSRMILSVESILTVSGSLFLGMFHVLVWQGHMSCCWRALGD